MNVSKGMCSYYHMPSVARVGCTEGPYEETGSMLDSCLYRARWGRTYVNETCVYRANRAILVCTLGTW